jgi:hypothetical protein
MVKQNKKGKLYAKSFPFFQPPRKQAGRGVLSTDAKNVRMQGVTPPSRPTAGSKCGTRDAFKIFLFDKSINL